VTARARRAADENDRRKWAVAWHDAPPLTPGEQLIERWAAEHERPCLHHHHTYQTPGGDRADGSPSARPGTGGDPTRRLAGPLAGEGGPAPSGRRQRPSSAEGPPPSADTSREARP
jgi:hypothetical protein